MNVFNRVLFTPFLALLLLLLPGTLLAHARWVVDSVTPPRTESTNLKTPPCGNIARTNRSTIFSAGQTIELEFEETINHPGHYRISFSPADDLGYDDVNNILVDNIPDVTNNGQYTQEVTIPMQVCSACSLQLIQVMTTSATPGPNDFYYSCTDIQITAAGDTTAPSPVSNVTSQAGDGQANLSWNNPVDDFYQVVILKADSPITDTPANGTVYSVGNMINGSEVIYVGKNANVTALPLFNDVPYYFKIFSQNPRKNYAAGVEINVTPSATNTGGDNTGGDNTGGDNTGNSPGNINSPESSGGGSFNILFLFLILITRVLASGKRLK